jgi:hypothetical protein
VEYENDMRSYLDIVEFYSNEYAPAMLVEEAAIPVDDISQRLADIVFKLRSYTDPTGGEYSLGFEEGLEMAARMIENLNNTGETSGS